MAGWRRRQPLVRSLRLLGALALVVLAALGWATAVAGPASAAATRTIHLSTTRLVPGQTIMVEGAGWPRGTPFQAVLCGSDATQGSVDCADDAAATFVPFTDGTLHGVLQVKLPPVPCPCVVQVTGVANDYLVTLPVTVVGAPTAPPAPAPYSDNDRLVATASVSGGNTLGSLFGEGARRTLVVTVRNTGGTTVDSFVLARWGTSSDPETVIGSPGAFALAPGQQRTVTVPFTLSPLSFGSYHVTAQVTGASVPVETSAATSTTPWGLLFLPIVVVAVVAFALWFQRRSAAAREAERLALGGTGLGALATMAAVATTTPRSNLGTLRMPDVLLLGEVDGRETAVPVTMLTLDSRGVGVTSPGTFELRVLAWSSIQSVRVNGYGPAEAHYAPVVEVETSQSTYRFAVPGSGRDELTAEVDHMVRMWGGAARAGAPQGPQAVPVLN